MPKLTEEQIKRKREIKTREMKAKKTIEINKKIETLRIKIHEQTELEIERQKDKRERKLNAYINRKRLEYDRKCKNEIRKLQGKEERSYKQPQISRSKKLQIALKISQENSRLRDTNADGYWYCISCQRWCSWEELAGGHEFSRTIGWVCLRESNINAQCHFCNDAMWPRWNPSLKKKTEMAYERNNRKKRWDPEIDMLIDYMQKSVQNPKKYAPSGDYISDIIPELIRRNEELWKKKSPEFRATHKPYKNWRKIYEKYFTPKERWEWE